MADASYLPKVYRKEGGNTQVIASGGKQEVESGGEVEVAVGGLLDVQGAMTLGGLQQLPSGYDNVFYADSVNGSNANAGTTMALAVADLNTAIALCTAGSNDLIVVADHHVEDLSSAETIDFDIAGITVIGLGQGTTRPRIDFNHATAGVDIGANDIKIRGLTFRPSVTIVTKAIDIETGVTGTEISGCEFLVGEAADGTDEFVTTIELVSGNHDTKIFNNVFRTHAACNGCVSAIKITAAALRVLITNNLFSGNWSTAAIIDGAACTEVFIANNNMKVKDGEPGIELNAGTTGIIALNNIESATLADADTAIVAAVCSWFNNYAVITDGQAASLIGAVEAESLEGKVDIIDTNLDLNNAWDVRTVVSSAMALDGNNIEDVFTVTNGPVELIGLFTHLTEAVSAHACAVKWQSDPTSGAANTDLCGTVDINAAAIGDVLYITGASADAQVNAANATAVPLVCATPAVVLPGGIDYVAANADPTSGIADVYLMYRPLTATAVVTAA